MTSFTENTNGQSVTYLADGATRTFQIPFTVYDTDSYTVEVTDSGGNSIINSLTVVKRTNEVIIIPRSGGTAVPSGSRVVITGFPARIVRNTDYSTLTDITPEALNNEFNRLYYLIAGLRNRE